MQYVDIPKHLVQNLLDVTVNNKWWTEPDRGIMDEDEVILKMLKEPPQYTEYINKFFNDGRDKLVEEFEYLKKWLQDNKCNTV